MGDLQLRVIISQLIVKKRLKCQNRPYAALWCSVRCLFGFNGNPSTIHSLSQLHKVFTWSLSVLKEFSCMLSTWGLLFLSIQSSLSQGGFRSGACIQVISCSAPCLVSVIFNPKILFIFNAFTVGQEFYTTDLFQMS